MAIFVCFATQNLAVERETIVADARRLGAFRQIEVWDEDRLAAQPEYETLPVSLKSGRGYGYFWWKPFVIRKAMEQARPDELVFYSDCGRYDGGFRLGEGLLYLLERYGDTGFTGVEVPQFGPASRWTRRECFHGLGCEGLGFERLPQIQATFMLWKKTDLQMQMVREWEAACRVPEMVADCSPEEMKSQPADLVENRYDQAVLSLITRKHRLVYIRTCGAWLFPLMRLFERTSAGNIAMKTTDFVAKCVRTNRVILPMVVFYLRKKFR